MNWNNVNLSDNYEREQNILDPLSFDTLLHEISCNCKEVTEHEVRRQFEEDLKSKIASAREVFEANLINLIEYAQNEREDIRGESIQDAFKYNDDF